MSEGGNLKAWSSEVEEAWGDQGEGRWRRVGVVKESDEVDRGR